MRGNMSQNKQQTPTDESLSADAGIKPQNRTRSVLQQHVEEETCWRSDQLDEAVSDLLRV